MKCRPAAAGSATAITIVSVAVVALVAGVLLAAAVAGSAQADGRTAADLGALAGAVELRRTADQARACAVAAEVVERNGAGLVTCTAEAGSVLRIGVRAGGPLGRAGVVAAVFARAGPVGARD